jgi:hypothetical protein
MLFAPTYLIEIPYTEIALFDWGYLAAVGVFMLWLGVRLRERFLVHALATVVSIVALTSPAIPQIQPAGYDLVFRMDYCRNEPNGIDRSKMISWIPDCRPESFERYSGFNFVLLLGLPAVFIGATTYLIGFEVHRFVTTGFSRWLFCGLLAVFGLVSFLYTRMGLIRILPEV